MTVTIVIPFHRGLEQLRESLTAARTSMPAAQIIVAADGAVEDVQGVAARCQALVVEVPAGPAGPATARNRAAAVAIGDLLLFVDADVVPAPNALQGLCDHLARTPGLGAVFGAYDLQPRATNFASQFKNLTHAYVHRVGAREAETFWAGLGGVRAAAFRAVGGFDERLRRPSVEDIDLGYRLRAAGFGIRLDPSIQGTHLKRWTVPGCVRTDVRDRGVPWVQLIHRSGAITNDLNTTWALRAAVVLSYGLLAALLSTPVFGGALPVAAIVLGGLVVLRRRYYGWCVEQRGWLFGVRVVAMDILHHWCNGVSLVVGTALSLATRVGVALPGAIPSEPWSGRQPGRDSPDRA